LAIRNPLAVVLLGTVVLTGCSETRSAPPTGLSSAGQMQQDTDRRDRWTYRDPQVDLRKYKRFQFEPGAVYTGADATFGSIDAGERQRYADVVAREFAKVISEKYPTAAAPGADVARVRLTLLGVESTVGGLATVSRLAPAGIAVNAAKGAAGESGSFTGSIEVAIEAFDSQSNALIFAGVRRATPAVYDLEATLSTTETVRSAAMVLAQTVRDGLDKANK
jgi:hypothetical protein